MHAACHLEERPLASGPRTVRSTDPADLSRIYEPDVNLCIIERAPTPDVDAYVRSLLARATPIEVVRTIRFESFDGQDLLPETLRDQTAAYASWRRDVVRLTALFCDLFEAESVGLRLRTLDKPMCPRFHTDFVPARLICAYGGPGTQWLPEEAVDRRRLGSRSGGLPDAESGLIRRGDAVEEIPQYAIALLKGERWEGNEGRGAVHRSPQNAKGEPVPRLLLTLDLV
ncbi:MAG: DUF1826 domain-containing protein [Gammaproteobacteria bacterium]|nr:DUF1826 domain-containing protein [Gammaproteobacteria bacterium]